MNPTITLIRGLPGSGKTSLAKRMAKPGTVVVAADDFFWKGGKYRYCRTKIGKAHEWCQARAQEAISAGQDVIVHNTFSRQWEMEPYISMWRRTPSYDLVVIDLFNAGLSDARLRERCVHPGVTEGVIRKMRERWQHRWRL